MSTFKRFHTFALALLTLVMLTLSAGALAQGNSQNAPGQSGMAPGKNKNLGHNNASNGVMARIHANRHIFYQGDPLEISVRFLRGAELITSGEADAYLVIFEPDTFMSAISLNENAGPGNSRLFDVDAVDVEEIPEGVYQMGVVLTVPGGNPFNLEEWYNGLLGLLTVQGLTVSSTPLDIDEDGDGFVDGDENGNGFVDEDPDEEEVEEDEDDEEGDEEEGDEEGSE